MVRFATFICVLISTCGLLAAESRFGLPVASLVKSKAFHTIELTGNKFASAERGSLKVATVVYGGPARYFVDVAVSNGGYSPITLADDFVRFHKNGTAVAFLDTRKVGSELHKAVDQTSTGPKITPATFLANAQVEQERARKREFAVHVAAFAHERQSMLLAAGKTTMYTFVFDAPDRERMGFELCVYVGDEEFKFEYKK